MYEDAFCVSPNAWGGVLNKDTIPSIRSKIVCGACNNQLQFASDAELLMKVLAGCVRVQTFLDLLYYSSAASRMCPTLCATAWASSIAAWRSRSNIIFLHSQRAQLMQFGSPGVRQLSWRSHA